MAFDDKCLVVVWVVVISLHYVSVHKIIAIDVREIPVSTEKNETEETKFNLTNLNKLTTLTPSKQVRAPIIFYINLLIDHHQTHGGAVGEHMTKQMYGR